MNIIFDIKPSNRLASFQKDSVDIIQQGFEMILDRIFIHLLVNVQVFVGCIKIVTQLMNNISIIIEQMVVLRIILEIFFQ